MPPLRVEQNDFLYTTFLEKVYIEKGPAVVFFQCLLKGVQISAGPFWVFVAEQRCCVQDLETSLR